MTQLSLLFDSKPEAVASSVVYFLEAPALGRVKIGFTESLERRMYDLRKGNATELRLLKAIPGSRRTEQALHRQFRKYRVRGEWFLFEPIRHEIDAITTDYVAKVPTCCDCGVAVKKRTAKRCRQCADMLRRCMGEYERKRRAVCVDCGKPISIRCVRKGISSGRCQRCGMVHAWAQPEYQASIRAARIRRRRECAHCQRAEPQLKQGAKYHPDCWRIVQVRLGQAPTSIHVGQLALGIP